MGNIFLLNITNLETTQATLEIFAGCVCLMLCIIILMNRHKAESMRMFVHMFFIAAIIFIAESLAYIFRGNTDTLSIFITRTTNLIVFLNDYILANFVVRYIYSLFKEKGVTLPRIYMKIANMCLAFCVLLLIVNQFTGWMYYFDSANYYHRNILWYIFTAGTVFCISVGCYAVVKYRNSVSRLTVISVFSYVTLPIICIILQAYIYGISFSNLGIALGILFMLISYLINWSKGDYVDPETTNSKRKLLEIVALFIIMVISMSASIFSCINSIKNISAKTSEKESRNISHLISDGLINEFQRPITISETMANSESFTKLIALQNPTEADNEAIISHLKTIRESFGYQTVFAVNDSTKAYYTQDTITKYLDVINNSHDIWYTDFLASEKAYELNIDTDEANNKALSAFINFIIKDEAGKTVGACGLCMVMSDLMDDVTHYENEYNVDIYLVNKEGLILVSSDDSKIEAEKLDCSYFDKVTGQDFYYAKKNNRSQLTKYIELLDSYLIISDKSPEKINYREITTPSIIIFIAGLFMMAIAFGIITIREQKTANALHEKKKASRTDDLTGLLNRHAYEEDLTELIANATSDNIGIIMLDLNGLKAVNDTIGHQAGDELISAAAHCMLPPFSQFGRVYRIGGDEFVAVLECTKEQTADAIKTMEHLAASWKGKYINEVSISKGMAHWTDYPGYPLREVIAEADKLMYKDKDAYYARTGKQRRK